VIKFLVGENVPSAEIHHRLQQQYGEECLLWRHSWSDVRTLKWIAQNCSAYLLLDWVNFDTAWGCCEVVFYLLQTSAVETGKWSLSPFKGEISGV